ncbi:MAG: hypothetical protein NT133_26005 [Alphaproteobacteria bacterium]|nr:hypothetical protein [Alphaproteobacteria bacterium]
MTTTITGGAGVTGTVTPGVTLTAISDPSLLITAGPLGAMGTIAGGPFGVAAFANGNWDVVNQGSVDGSTFGIILNGGTFTNSGTASRVTGGSAGVYGGGIGRPPLTVHNEGTISSASIGISLATKGVILNHPLISILQTVH